MKNIIPKRVLVDGRVLISHPNRGTARNLSFYLESLENNVGLIEYKIFKGIIPYYKKKNFFNFLIYLFEEQIIIPLYALIFSCNFVLYPNHTCSILPLFAKKILIIHDVMFADNIFKYSLKGNMFLSSFYRYFCIKITCLISSPKIITISKTSKKRIPRYFNTKNNEIFIIPVTINKVSETSIIKDIIKKKYILSVTGSADHKNFHRLYEAFIELNNDDIFLVCVGNLNEARFYNKNLILMNNLSNAQMSSLYKHCIGLIFPSLDEGFGIPLLESMYFGKEIACSDIKIFREIMKDKPIYFDPQNVSSINKAIKFMCSQKRTVKNYDNILKKYEKNKISKLINDFWGIL